MSFLKELLERLKAVSELDKDEERDVILNAIDIIVYMGKLDLHMGFCKELYKKLNDELRVHIEKEGIKEVKTEIDYSMYKFEINKLKINLNTAKEKIDRISGESYELTYSYEENNGIRAINNMIVYVA